MTATLDTSELETLCMIGNPWTVANVKKLWEGSEALESLVAKGLVRATGIPMSPYAFTDAGRDVFYSLPEDV